MPISEAVVAIYHTHPEAEQAVKELQRRGMDMRCLSIVAKDYHTDEQVVGYYNVGDRMKRWGSTGALWGGFWGLLFGSAFFAIPGIGPLLVAGPLVTWIVGALEGAAVVGGIGVLGAGLDRRANGRGRHGGSLSGTPRQGKWAGGSKRGFRGRALLHRQNRTTSGAETGFPERWPCARA